MAAATLGQIGIDENHKVAWVTGQGTPPPDGMFTEPELRALLEALTTRPLKTDPVITLARSFAPSIFCNRWGRNGP